ncbi:MAG: DUF6929 family protein [Flavobacteriales bacterium]
MEVKLIHSKVLKEVPSGSGVEHNDGVLFICGDDAPYLFKTNLNGEILQKIKIWDWQEEGRIPKLLKPDFEAMAHINDEVFLFGSGSLNPRNVLVKVNSENGSVEKYDLGKLYENLRYEAGLKMDDFNIEAAAVYKDKLLLLNRGDNSILSLSLSDFFLSIETGKELTEVEIHKFHLPLVEGYVAGFSGASVYRDKLVFSASVEKTTDWINDGEILGSFIGLIDLCNYELSACVLVQNILAKIEGLCIIKESGQVLELAAVADNDDGMSTLIKLELKF